MTTIKFVPDHWYTPRLQTITKDKNELQYKKKYYNWIKKAQNVLGTA